MESWIQSWRPWARTSIGRGSKVETNVGGGRRGFARHSPHVAPPELATRAVIQP
jgi:hypothetical protein